VNDSRSKLPTVVVPVYNAAPELDRCLRSLHATLPLGAEVLVIDDASPDPEVRKVLHARQRRAGPRWRFLRNPRNLGFVATANRGMRESGGDLVLLNSDTEVTSGWLEGLARCLASDAAIATATPWTNNGEIASMPRFCAANPVPADPAAVAAVVARSGAPAYPELPTAVGFWMAIAGRAIERIGLFDEARFGKGYGEENDFSMRVRAAGLRNVLCDDVYVLHLGGRSFGPLGLRPGDDSMRRLLDLHPGYLELVGAFIAEDPLAKRRQALVEALERAGVDLGV
jgi:GT2 family glycosyltransferase